MPVRSAMIQALRGKKLTEVRPSNTLSLETHRGSAQCALKTLLLLAESHARIIRPIPAAAMANDHPDAPKQFGIRLNEETMELVSAIQEHRKQANKSITLAAVVEDAIECHYNRLVSEGAIKENP